MKKYSIKETIVFIFAIAGFLVLTGQDANAHVFDNDDCHSLAKLSSSIADARDEGVPLKVLVSSILETSESVRGQNVLIQDEEDDRVMVDMARMIYRHPEIQPGSFKKGVLKACLSTLTAKT